MIERALLIVRFIRQTGIVPKSLVVRGGIILIILKFIVKIAANMAKRMTKFDHLPKELWKNDYPIILVHGFMGSGPDSVLPMTQYFHHAVQTEVLKENEGMVFIAAVSPNSNNHDRACELYQQIIGINSIRRQNGIHEDENGIPLVKAVYGNAHTAKCHKYQKVYKPRYLR